jgi:hypothetical protein
MKIKIEVSGSVSFAEIFDADAPITSQSLGRILPIETRALAPKYSGEAWYTEGNYELGSREIGVENPAGRLQKGDIIYYPRYGSNGSGDRFEIGIAYGYAQWHGPLRDANGLPKDGPLFAVPLAVCLLGRIVEGLDDFVAASKRIIIDGPLQVTMSEAI